MSDLVKPQFVPLWRTEFTIDTEFILQAMACDKMTDDELMSELTARWAELWDAPGTERLALILAATLTIAVRRGVEPYLSAHWPEPPEYI